MTAVAAPQLVVVEPQSEISGPTLPEGLTPQNFNWVMRLHIKDNPAEALYGIGELIADWIVPETVHWYQQYHSEGGRVINPDLVSYQRAIAKGAEAVIFQQDCQLTPESGRIWFRESTGDWTSFGKTHRKGSQEAELLDSLNPIKLPKRFVPESQDRFRIKLPRGEPVPKPEADE